MGINPVFAGVGAPGGSGRPRGSGAASPADTGAAVHGWVVTQSLGCAPEGPARESPAGSGEITASFLLETKGNGCPQSRAGLSFADFVYFGTLDGFL